jgi:fatty acid desaturase
MRTAPGSVALASGRAPALDTLPAALDPSTASFRALALQVRAMGLLDRRPGYYRVKITLTIVAFFAGWALFVLAGNSWAALAVAPLVGIMFTQLGFLGHDLGHNQVFGARRRNHLLGLLVANTLIGLSFGWWVPKHSAHHAHPNELGRDPDIGEGVVLASSGPPGVLASWLARWQAPLFFPLMLLRSVGLHVLGIKRLAGRRDRAAAVEASLITLHAALYLTVVLWVLSPLKALAFVAVQQAVFSLYLGVSFAPNHKGMPIIESATAAGFARRQVITARNISGGRFTTFMLGGLNYQIEHHLFESMPRPNLRRVQGLVRDFCVAADLGYQEESFVGSFRQIVQHLSDAGAAAGRRPD